MSANNYTIPNPCKHLVDYKLQHGLKGYDLIQDLLNCSPYGRTMVIKSKSDMPRCSFCSGNHGRLFMCLICSSVACSVNYESNHTLFHSESFTGHEIYVDIERAELFCSVCCDQVYDPEFDKAVVCKHLDFGNGISGNSDLMLGNRKRLDFGNGISGNSDLRLGESKRLDFGNGVLGNSDLRLSKRKRLDFGCDLDFKNSKRLVLRRKKMSSKSCFPLGLRGLNNLGNTCFMNSVLQALFHAPPFRNYFLSDRHNHESCRKSSTDRLCLPCDVDVVFSAVFSGERTPYSPANFLYSWWQHSENLASYEQQDAHEFFISMLDRIHEKLGKATLPIKENGDCQCIAHRVFSGLLRSDVTCTSCGFTSSTYDPCLDISLDLNTSSSFTTNSTTKSNKPNEALASSTLAGCLDLFTRPEKLGPDQKLFCENCQQKQNALKQMSLKKLPQVLCFHIKRFEHSPTRKTSRKIDRHLKFPFSLDMGPYLSSSIVKKRFGNRIFSFEGEEKDVCNEYEVFAVVTHCGMLESGHYVTYLRLRNQWYRCDDAWVTEVDEEVVRASQCYLMFYVQKVLYVKGSEDLGCQPLLARGDPFVPIAGCC